VNELRWGIIATGSIAQAFARDLTTSRTGRLVAMASRTPTGAHVTYDALLADPTVDAVYVATPHPMHAEWAVRAAEAGKHVLCEKPMAMTEQEAATIFDAAAAHGVFAMEAFMYRCHPQTAALVSLLERIGEVREIEAVHCFHGGDRLDPTNRLLAPELGGGAILDVGCYCVSGALLAARSEPVSLVGAGTLGATGVDLRATATLTFASGVEASLRCGIDDDTPPLLRVVGTEGTVTSTAPWLPRGTTQLELDGDVTSVTAERGLYAYEADVVADCVARGEQQAPFPAPAWDETLQTMRVLDWWRDVL
jgi:predicted dehydrogenase